MKRIIASFDPLINHSVIGDIRGPGLMIGVELVRNRNTKEPAREEVAKFVSEGLKRGVIFAGAKYQGLGNVVKIKPPLVITDKQVDRVLAIFEEILKLVSQNGPGSNRGGKQ